MEVEPCKHHPGNNWIFLDQEQRLCAFLSSLFISSNRCCKAYCSLTLVIGSAVDFISIFRRVIPTAVRWRRAAGVVGYNLQVAVDTEHHLIVAHEVTNSGSDRAQLARIAMQAKAVLQTETLEAVADRGYFNSTKTLLSYLELISAFWGTKACALVFIGKRGTFLEFFEPIRLPAASTRGDIEVASW
jgi:hypothetical protein